MGSVAQTRRVQWARHTPTLQAVFLRSQMTAHTGLRRGSTQRGRQNKKEVSLDPTP